MLGKVIKVEFFGTLPTVFSNKCKAYCCAIHENYSNQINEYPKQIVKDYNRAVWLYENLMKDFGNLIEPSVVNPMSFRGLWLSIKHKIRSGLWLVISGKIAIDAYSDYEEIKKAIKNEISEYVKVPP